MFQIPPGDVLVKIMQTETSIQTYGLYTESKKLERIPSNGNSAWEFKEHLRITLACPDRIAVCNALATQKLRHRYHQTLGRWSSSLFIQQDLSSMRSYNPSSQLVTTGSIWETIPLVCFMCLEVILPHFLHSQDLDLCGAGNSIVHADTSLELGALLRKCNLPASWI